MALLRFPIILLYAASLSSIYCTERKLAPQAVYQQNQPPQNSSSPPCACPEECQCLGQVVICTGITEIPRCFPGDIVVKLVIQNSPSLYFLNDHSFVEYGAHLESLILRNTGLTYIDHNAFKGFHNLKTLEISTSMLESINFSLKIPTLQTLNVTNSNRLSLKGYQFEKLTYLQILDISRCNIQDLSANVFDNVENLVYLNLESNKYLGSISQFALYHLWKLEKIYINDCGLSVLYPEYFSSPYESGHLKEAVASSNKWVCSEMCEFIKWMNENPNFYNVFEGGFCRYPSYLAETPLRYLEYDSVDQCKGLPPVILLVAVLSIVMLACCCGLALKNCFVGLCRENANQTNQNGEPQTTSRENHASDFTNDMLTVISDVEPPSYDTVLKNSRNFPVSLSQNTSGNDSCPPPPYEEASGSRTSA
ncbi:trophoblast glycoprotein-like [Styela clava]